MAMVWYEIKKVLLRPSCQIALLLLLLLSGRFCIQVMWGSESAYWINEDGQMETGYNAMQKLRVAQAEWSGELNQELLEKALAELKQAESEGESHPEDPDYAYKRCQGLQNIRALMNNAFKSNYVWKYEDWYLAETLEPEQLSDFYENRTRQLKDWLYDENSFGYQAFSEQEKQYLIRCYESLETPFEVGYATGWDMAYRISYYIILYGSILMAFLTAGIFANESRWKTNSLYFCTMLGRQRGTAAKLTAGFLLTTIVYWGVLLTVNLITLGLMGFDGGSCPIQADYHNWNRIYNITFFQRSVYALADGYLLWMFLSAFVMLVSAASGSLSLSAVIPSLLMLGTDFLDRHGYVEKLPDVIRLFPHKMATAYGNESVVLYSVFGKIMPPITIQRVLYFCLTVLMAIGCYQIFRCKQVR